MTETDSFRNALILSGPTASGKSSLALELAARMGAEIVAMDSMTLYRGMDIGTAKPSQREREGIRHHLIDVLDPWESGNVAWWRSRAEECCADIQKRGKTPLLVGGTPFYLKAVMLGLFDSPPVDAELRQQLEEEARRDGPETFHTRLAAVDPIAAGRLHPNDVRRTVRAMEVWKLTGKPISAWQQQDWWGESKLPENTTTDGVPRCLVLEISREELYARINRRVEKMFEQGWIDEVRQLLALPHPLSKEASQALGYREIRAFLDGEFDLRTTVELIQTRSRQFAKRQLTWFRQLPNCQKCDQKMLIDLWRTKMK